VLSIKTLHLCPRACSLGCESYCTIESRSSPHASLSDPRQASTWLCAEFHPANRAKRSCHLGTSPEASNGHHIEPFCERLLQGWWCEKRNSPLPRPATSGLLSCGTRALLQSFRLMPVELIKVCFEAQDRICLSASISCVRETQLKKDQLQWLLGCRHSGHGKCLNPQDLAPAPSGDGAHQRSVFRNATTHGAFAFRRCFPIAGLPAYLYGDLVIGPLSAFSLHVGRIPAFRKGPYIYRHLE
jgi:hypothetical protein